MQVVYLFLPVLYRIKIFVLSTFNHKQKEDSDTTNFCNTFIKIRIIMD